MSQNETQFNETLKTGINGHRKIQTWDFLIAENLMLHKLESISNKNSQTLRGGDKTKSCSEISPKKKQKTRRESYPKE